MRTKNRFLIENYPFITPNDINGTRIENPDYSSTLLDDIPEGWKVGFGYFFCEDLKDLLVKLDMLDTFQILQIKEKFGKLCVYTNTDNEHIQSLIDSYSERSLHCCADCASQDAIPIKALHVVPLCERCFHRYYPNEPFTVFEAYADMFK